MADSTGGKPGLSPVAWVGLGCGALLLLGVVAVVVAAVFWIASVKRVAAASSGTPPAVAAEMAIRANPALELIASDPAAGTVTFRERQTGRETTVTYDQAREGRITVHSEEGTTTIEGDGGIRTETATGVATFGKGGLEKLPRWFTAPGAVTGWRSIMHQEKRGLLSGTIHGESGEPGTAVIDAFSASLEAAGFRRTARTGIAGTVSVNYERDGDTVQLVTVNAIPDGDATRVQVSYDERPAAE